MKSVSANTFLRMKMLVGLLMAHQNNRYDNIERDVSPIH